MCFACLQDIRPISKEPRGTFAPPGKTNTSERSGGRGCLTLVAAGIEPDKRQGTKASDRQRAADKAPRSKIAYGAIQSAELLYFLSGAD